MLRRGSGIAAARSRSGCPTNVASMPFARRSDSSNGRITAAFVMTRAIAFMRPARDAHTWGVMKYSTGTPAAFAAAPTFRLKNP